MPRLAGFSAALDGFRNESINQTEKSRGHIILPVQKKFVLSADAYARPGMIKPAIIIGCLMMTVFLAESQSLKDHLLKGDRHYQKKDYQNALKNYLEALALDGDDARTNFKAGISFLYEKNFSQAVVYLSRAYTINPDVDRDIDYHLGMACQQSLQFKQAGRHFEALRVKNKNLVPIANQKIQECIVGDSLMRVPSNAQVEPLPEQINTSFSEFGPLISVDGQTLIFTSNRSAVDFQVKSGTNTEDVYISERQDGAWAPPQKISENINVKSNGAAMSLSRDGNTIFLYYEEGGGNIYASSRKDDQWSKPLPLNRFINHPQYRESGACLSPDGKLLFFSSNRPGGRGGYDLYVSELGSNGQWGRAANLGSAVNTRKNEESPFMHFDGSTLYFSSNGHPTLGDHDIFKTTLVNGKWTAPANLGYPINTSGFEGYFVLSDDSKTGYFTSRRGGSTATLDIYSADFESSNVGPEIKKATPVMSNEEEGLRIKRRTEIEIIK